MFGTNTRSLQMWQFLTHSFLIPHKKEPPRRASFLRVCTSQMQSREGPRFLRGRAASNILAFRAFPGTCPRLSTSTQLVCSREKGNLLWFPPNLWQFFCILLVQFLSADGKYSDRFLRLSVRLQGELGHFWTFSLPFLKTKYEKKSNFNLVYACNYDSLTESMIKLLWLLIWAKSNLDESARQTVN